MSTKVQAMVATCVDLRFQKYFHTWLDARGLYDKHDRVAIAGGVKDRELLMGQLRISIELHQTAEVFLFNHQDCGAYKERGFANQELEREAHENDLRNTKAAILAEFPQLKVQIYFVNLDGKFIEVE